MVIFRDVPYRRWKKYAYIGQPKIVISRQAIKLITLMGKAIKSGKTVSFECRTLPEDMQRKLGVYDVIDLTIED